MAERPHGTVTFVFTDIEGSTRLVRELGERYGDVQAEHRRLIREAFAAHGGEEVDTQGDSFLYVFARARDAALGAAEAQQALAAHPWPPEATVRVRMGMHTAEPSRSDEGYHGLGVHRAARIMAAGHGGQVLASQATASVLADDRLPGVELRDLGERRLKDLERSERITQLDVAGLPVSFPPLRTGAPAAPPLHRRPLTIGVAAGVLAAAVAIPVFALGRGSDGTATSRGEVPVNAVAAIDPVSRSMVDQAEEIPAPGRVTAGAGAVWATSSKRGGSVVRIDTESGEITDTIDVGAGPIGIAFGAGDVWVANSLDGTVSRIDGETAEVFDPIQVGNEPTAVAFGEGAVWVGNAADRSVSKLDPATGAVAATLPVSAAARGIVVAEGGVWLSDPARNRLVRLDPGSGAATDEVGVGSGPTAVAYGAGSVWVTNSLDGTLTAVDPKSATVRATVPVGAAPNGVAASRAGVWVTDEVSASLVGVDPQSLSTTRTRLGGRPNGIAEAGGRLWVAVQATGRTHRGGVLRLVSAAGEVDAVDPARSYSGLVWGLLATTHDGLVALTKVGGAEGNTLVPDLARALPTPTDGATTYTFRLRSGIRFSNGRTVEPADVRASFERMFRARSPRSDFYDAIVGAPRCRKRPARCRLGDGVVADDRAGTVTFRLTRPDPEFLYKLALPFAFVVPAGTPIEDGPIPGTGPYRIASYEPGRRVRLARNPHFRAWSRAAQPEAIVDEIALALGGREEDHLAAVGRGRADAVATFPSKRLPGVRARFPGQLHIIPTRATFAAVLNVNRPPFESRLARRAVAYALDRRLMVDAFGGNDLAAPTCQVLPPNAPAYRPYCPYTVSATPGGGWVGPDLARARSLVARSGTRGARVDMLACATPCDFARAAQVLRTTLEQLGYDVRVRRLPDADSYFEAFYGSTTTTEAAITGWFPDYPAPSSFFELVSCQGSPYTCTPAVARRVSRAVTAQSSDPEAALRLWTQLDRTVVDQALLVPLVNGREYDFVSRRVGNYQRHSVFGMLLSQVWVR